MSGETEGSGAGRRCAAQLPVEKPQAQQAPSWSEQVKGRPARVVVDSDLPDGAWYVVRAMTPQERELTGWMALGTWCAA